MTTEPAMAPMQRTDPLAQQIADEKAAGIEALVKQFDGQIF